MSNDCLQPKTRYSKPKSLKGTTRHLYLAGIGHRLGTDEATVRSICQKFGELDDGQTNAIEITLDKGFCCVSFVREDDAIQALETLNGKIEPLTGRRLHVRYATIEKKAESPEPECTSLTAHVEVPGLILIPEFIGEEEEQVIVSQLNGDAGDIGWETGLARRVAHFGHVFDYQTRGVDFERLIKQIPSWGHDLVARIQNAVKFENPSDQLTVNEYEPGQGIAYHVDTHSAFEEELISLTLNAGCVMEFRKPCIEAETALLLDDGVRSCASKEELQEPRTASSDPQPCESPPCESAEKKPKLELPPVDKDFDACCGKVKGVGGEFSQAQASSSNAHQESNKTKVDHKLGKVYVAHKHVYLPPRCLVVMTGEARYLWEHHIASRKTDKVDGTLIPRGTRYSLTFRRVIRNGQHCQCSFPIACDAPLEVRRRRVRKMHFHPTKMEQEHVHSIYESIAPHWNHTRARRKVLWPRIKEFIEQLPPGSLIADIGCGDGKYFGVNPTSMMIGCDRSQRLLDICVDKQYEVICCDALKVPYRSCAFDAVICVAVMHHFSTEAHRVSVLKELARITRSGGLIDIQVWAFEQEEGSKKQFAKQDCLVPWKLQKKYATDQDLKNREIDKNGLIHFDRFCHVFRKGELEQLCRTHLPHIEILASEGYTKCNWHIQLRKL